MKKQMIGRLLCCLLVLVVCLVLPVVSAAEEAPAAVLVALDGSETATEAPLTDFDPEVHKFVKLYQDLDLGTMEEETLWIDLNGNDLTVTGSGTLYAFDSANDTYDANACGTVIRSGSVDVVADVQVPDGNRYFAVSGEAGITMHRMDMHLTAVSLRPTEAGLYYKALYNCDSVLEKKIQHYGVVLSVYNMPGADFITEKVDDNQYTVASNFRAGVTATSGSVFGIMKAGRTAEENAAYGAVKIYANPYIHLVDETELVCVADTENVGKKITDEDFTGSAYSLQDVMNMIDGSYYAYPESTRERVDGFYDQWKEKGMGGWKFEDIKHDYLRKLKLDANNQGFCPVCQKIVTWEGIDPANHDTTRFGAVQDKQHLYLMDSIEYSGTDGDAFITAPSSSSKAGCLHLNGHDLISTADRTIYGSGGVLNVMGTGTVSGYINSSAVGSTIQINTSSKVGTVNLYGGTYRQAENAHTGSYVIAIANNGGIINVYKTAKIEANASNKAVRSGASSLTNSVLGIYGAEVEGNIYMVGSAPAKGNHTRATFAGATITGSVELGADAVENFELKLSGKLNISKLTLHAGLLADIQEMLPGSAVTLDAEGIFTAADADIEAFKQYFTPYSRGYGIFVKNNALRCAMDYVSNLKLDENGQAFCPVCKDDVTWTPISEAPDTTNLPVGSHSYLTKSITAAKNGAIFSTPSSSGKIACLHLNGYDITNTSKYAIFSSSGVLNVMGSGTVSGKAGSAAQAGAVSTNVTYSNMRINLYSGTYANTNTSTTYPVVGINNAGGKINIYEDVTINRPGKKIIHVGTLTNKGTAILGIYGAELTGDVTIKMPIAYNSSTGYGGKTSTTTIENAIIHGTVTIESGTRTTVTLKGRTVIDKLTINEGAPIVLNNLLPGSGITVNATGAFTQANESVADWIGYFNPFDGTKIITILENALCVSDPETQPEEN